jgi:hypothetical protein
MRTPALSKESGLLPMSLCSPDPSPSYSLPSSRVGGIQYHLCVPPTPDRSCTEQLTHPSMSWGESKCNCCSDAGRPKPMVKELLGCRDPDTLFT